MSQKNYVSAARPTYSRLERAKGSGSPCIQKYSSDHFFYHIASSTSFDQSQNCGLGILWPIFCFLLCLRCSPILFHIAFAAGVLHQESNVVCRLHPTWISDKTAHWLEWEAYTHRDIGLSSSSIFIRMNGKQTWSTLSFIICHLYKKWHNHIKSTLVSVSSSVSATTAALASVSALVYMCWDFFRAKQRVVWLWDYVRLVYRKPVKLGHNILICSTCSTEK